MNDVIRQNLLQRHNELKNLGKVTEAVNAAGVTYQTYERAINGVKGVKAVTIERILEGQAKVIDLTRKRLQLA